MAMMVTGRARAIPVDAVLMLMALVCLLAVSVSAVGTADPRMALKAPLQLSDADLAALLEGTPVAKTLTSSASREMTTVGGIRIRGGGMARFVEQFKTLEGFRTSQFVLQIEKFGQTPQLSDLDKLTLEPDDFESLRTCRVGDCEVQLSADDIKRLAQVGWRSPTAAQEAGVVYRAILFDHLLRYRAAGTKSLPHYQDRQPGVSLADETESLLEARPSLLDDAPAMRDLIRTYPNGTDPQTQEFFYWVKEAFGFKPVVSLNHTRVHTDVTTGRVTIVTAQIYASHYMEGSLSISALMPAPSSSDGSAFYWAYANRARVGRLSGVLGVFARPIMQRRARSGLLKSLLQTRQRFEAAGRVP